jgi:hypothetical protein
MKIEKRSDLGSNVVANDGNTTGVNESRVLATDLMYVSTELGYNLDLTRFTQTQINKKGIVKFDWNINDDHKLAVIYNFLDASKDKPAHPTAIRRRGPDNNTCNLKIRDIKLIIKLVHF